MRRNSITMFSTPPLGRAGSSAGQPSKQTKDLGGKKPQKSTDKGDGVPMKKGGRLARVEELIGKAEEMMNLSGNFKKEYKATALAALNKIQKICVEMEAELEAAKKGIGSSPAVEKVPERAIDAELRDSLDLLQDNNARLKDIQASLAKQQEAVEPQRTYAAAIATVPPTTIQIPPTYHTMAVFGEEEQLDEEVILEDLTSILDATDGWTKVENMRRVRGKGKIFLGFKTEEERSRVKEKILDKLEGIKVEEIKNRDPLLILREVPRYLEVDEIIKAFKNQNEELFADLDEESGRVRLKYRRVITNENEVHVVLEVSPILWRRATERGYAYIDLSRVRVEDKSPVIQCSHCLGYGHTKKHCRHQYRLTCAYCAENNHTMKECHFRTAPPKCANCDRTKTGAESGHMAFDDKCPVRKRFDAIARSSVSYS